MFGYVRPQESELLVKHHELYRAIYCGLCKCMRKKVSFFASLTLNYDFVFLALIRAELTNETYSFCQKRCPVHPLKKRNCPKGEYDSLYFTAMVHLCLSYEKICDDLRDSDLSFGKRIAFSLYRPLLAADVKRLRKRDERFCAVHKAIEHAYQRLAKLEAASCCDTDELAFVCANALEESCAVGLEGEEERLMRAAAGAVGKLTYLLDACDDIFDDEKNGCFNPFLQTFHTAEAALEHIEEIGTVLALYAQELSVTTDLIAKANRYGPLCDNITQKGVPLAIQRAIQKNEAHTVHPSYEERKTT